MERRGLCARLGFAVGRRESVYLVPTDPALTGLPRVELPRGVRLVRADRVDLDRLRLLDDALRQDVPGTDGWEWSASDFREETFGAGFDPALYLVAVSEPAGEYVGIARVWNRSALPRLGFVGVCSSFRRRGVARVLLRDVLGVLHERGRAEVRTEVDETNVASRTLIEGLGARPSGGSLELVRSV